MKILLLTYSCSPNGGSEEKVGWQWAINLAKAGNKVTVLTKYEKGKERIINNYLERNPDLHLSFKYIDMYQSRTVRIVNHIFDSVSIRIQMYQLFLYRVAKKVCKHQVFDIVHQVTPVTIRVLGFSWKLGIPFFIGPLGGGQAIPIGLSYYARNIKYVEKFRDIMNFAITHSIYYRHAMKNITKIYCANPETLSYMKKISSNTPLGLMSDTGGVESHKELKREFPEKKVIEILWVGRLVELKGLELLFDAVSQTKTKNQFIIRIVGKDQKGLQSYYKQLAKKCGIDECTKFEGETEFNRMSSIYESADIFVFTSLRESSGSVLWEAAESGLPIIMPNQNAAFLFKKSALQFSISSKSKAINEISIFLEKLIDDNNARKEYGRLAYFNVTKNNLFKDKVKIAINDYKNTI